MVGSFVISVHGLLHGRCIQQYRVNTLTSFSILTIHQKSYEGRVGRQYPELDAYITTPNMETMTEPLLGPQSIRLRRDFHYREHDPLFMPQPFHQSTPHLMCIRFPGTGDNSIFWLLPTEDLFEPIPGHALSNTPLGRLPIENIKKLNSEFEGMVLCQSSPAPAGAPKNAPSPTSLSKDTKIKEYSSRFRYLMDRLSSPAIFLEALMLWQIAQRILLELDARITWLQFIAPVFLGPHSSWEVPPMLEVVGALAFCPEIAENCFRVSCFLSQRISLLIALF